MTSSTPRTFVATSAQYLNAMIYGCLLVLSRYGQQQTEISIEGNADLVWKHGGLLNLCD